jgi:hypothetical protein
VFNPPEMFGINPQAINPIRMDSWSPGVRLLADGGHVRVLSVEMNRRDCAGSLRQYVSARETSRQNVPS